MFIGFANGAVCQTQNSDSASWVIYTSTVQVLSLGGICLWPSSNNVDEYSTFIELLRDSISHGVHSLKVRLWYILIYS